jgi:NAD(P)-dependent dehydrogenase (short-subunit alcohol dehydrogenase family)
MIDAAVELAVVPSFSRIGPAVRRRLYDWADPQPGALVGRTALVTGPTSGLGHAAAARLAGLGARVVLAGRSHQRLTDVRDDLVRETGEDRYPIVVVDMSSLESVQAAVGSIRDTEPRLDVLIDNAGAIFPDRGESVDGIERTLAVLVVGPFALTRGLLPLLRQSPDARAIAVTSGGMYTQPVDFDDLDWETRPFSGPRAYAQAKRIQVALMREWARRLAGSSISFNAMHPGWADTPGLAESLPGFHGLMGPLLRSVDEGVDTITWLATSPSVRPPGGRLYLDRRPRPFDRAPQTRLTAADRRELWAAIATLAGVDPAI